MAKRRKGSRKFNGRSYALIRTTGSKREADRSAKILRDDGQAARVIKTGRTGPYAVYTAPKKKRKTKRKQRPSERVRKIVSPAKPGEPASQLFIDDEGAYRIKRTSQRAETAILMKQASRKFNGRTYLREAAFKTKADAQKKAQKIRDQGKKEGTDLKARVVKMRINTASATKGRIKSVDGYGVYVNLNDYR